MAFVILLSNYLRNKEVNNIKTNINKNLPQVSPLFTKLGGKIVNGVPLNSDGNPIIDLNSDGWDIYSNNYWRYNPEFDEIHTPQEIYDDKNSSINDKINKICDYWKREYIQNFKKKVKGILDKYNWGQIIFAFIVMLLNLPNKNKNTSIGLMLGSTGIILSNVGFIYRKVNVLVKLIFSAIMLGVILYVGNRS